MRLDHRSGRFNLRWLLTETDAGASPEAGDRFPDVDGIDPDDPRGLAHDEAIEQLFPRDGVVPPGWWSARDRDGLTPTF
jgi:hypothetical protein